MCATAAVHAEGARYDVSVRIDAEARRLDGHAHIVVPNDTSAPLTELWLWRYPERFAARSPALNDYNFYWVYPTRFNAGHMRTGEIYIPDFVGDAMPPQSKRISPKSIGFNNLCASL